MLRNYEPDPYHVINFDDIELKEDVIYIEKLIRIAAHEERKLRTKVISKVKIIWRQDKIEEEATWEVEKEKWRRYPHLFED